MPRNVGTPDQAATAQTRVKDFTDVKSSAPGKANRFAFTRPLSRFERTALNAEVEAVYLYNISPIWKWMKPYPGLGTLVLLRRKGGMGAPKLEDLMPTKLEKRLVRGYDGGNRIQRLMVEDPLEIVQDFCVCSPEFPGRPENNLTQFGVFYTVGEELEDMPLAKQQQLMDEAELKHRNKCLEFVGHADALANSSNMQFAIVEVHRNCALYLHEAYGEELREWVGKRGKLNPTAECQFCGFDNKRGVAKCRNCHEVLDPALYAKLQTEVKGKKDS